MDRNRQRRTLFALLVVSAVVIFSLVILPIVLFLVSFVTGVIWNDNIIEYSLNFDIISRITAIDIDSPSLVLEYVFQTILFALFVRISSPPDERDRVIELAIGGIMAVIILLPLTYSLLIIFLFVLYQSYSDIENPFEQITDSDIAELIEGKSSQIRGFTFNSIVISLAAIAFLFSEITDPSSDPSFSSFVLSILFLFASILISEYTLRYKILVEYQSFSFLFGIIFLFLGIVRSIGQFTGIGVTGLEIVFLFIMGFWSLGGQDQRNTYRIVSGDDPRLDDGAE